MKRFSIPSIITGGVFLILADLSPAAGGEAQFLETLRASGNAVERCEACRKLLDAGSAECIPDLAVVLREERVGHAALHTLERMPFPEAGAALRAALGTVTGPMKVGVIDALGWRKDGDALSLLAPLLDDPDSSMATAAACALGRIGGPDAAAALTKASDRKEPTVRLGIREGLLACAEQFRADGEEGDAAEIYRRLYAEGIPRQVRCAALSGLLRTDGRSFRRLFKDAVNSPDPQVRSVALQVLLGTKENELFVVLQERWVTLPPDVKGALLEKHGRLGEEAPSTVLMAANDKEEMVRLTALRAMGEMGQVSMIPVLARTAASSGKAEQLAARRSLARIHGPNVNEKFLDYLDGAPVDERVELLRILGERGNTGSSDVLLRYADGKEEAEKQAALHALYLLADPKTLGPLEKLVKDADSDDERKKLQRIVDEIRQNGASP